MTQPRRSGSNGREPIDVSIWGVSDSELLAIVDDLADENGWTHTYAVRVQIGEDPEQAKHRSGVGSRLAWMKRYGWLEKGEKSNEWRLTAMGHEILDNPGLSRAFENQMAKLNAAQKLRLTREIAEGGHGAPMEIRQALRRQWMRSIGR
jgi:hypothetical protein